MVDISELDLGMRVKIVDSWVHGCYQNPGGSMDEYLGAVMTIAEFDSDTYGSYVRMEEDGGIWCWYKPAIDYIIEDEIDEDDTAEFERFISDWTVR